MEKTLAISGKKATFTAMCIIPPKELWPEIQAIRSLFDPAYARWMPHINMAFPFLQPTEFELGKSMMQEELKDFPAFKIRFNELGYFSHGKKAILWTKPETDGNPLQDLETRIVKVFPFCDDLMKKSTEGFHPHLTLGNFGTKEVEAKKAEFQKTWTPKEFTVTELSIIKRDGQTSPFYVAETVQLKPLA